MIDKFLNNKYMLQKSERFDDFMKELGVDPTIQKLGNTVSTIVELQKRGAEYTYNIYNVVKNMEIKFKPGVEFERETLDGRKIKSVFSINDATLLEIQTGDKKVIILREFYEDRIVATFSVGSVKGVRIYKRVILDRLPVYARK